MQYRTIVCDPPWRYSTSLPGFGKKSGEVWKRPGSVLPYPTLTVAEIAALPVATLADPAGCHLYLWTTNAHLERAFGVARAWGFTPSITLVWCKAPHGMSGFPTWNICTEYVLFCRRGTLKPLTRQPRNWFEWKRGKHSQKPEGLQDMVEATSPGPRLEMFARRPRDGWAVYGDEVADSITLGVA